VDGCIVHAVVVIHLSKRSISMNDQQIGSMQNNNGLYCLDIYLYPKHIHMAQKSK